MSAELDITYGLNETLEALTLPYAIAPENIQINWNLQEPFIRSYDQPVLKTQATLGTNGVNLHKGIFHIEICHPPNTGPIKPREIADLIMPSFKRGTVISYNGLLIKCEKCEIKTAYTENSWYILPIFVVYYTQAGN